METTPAFEPGWTAGDALAEVERLRTDNEKQRCQIVQWTGENTELKATLRRMLDEFAASLNSGKPIGYTAGSMQRALRVIREAEALLND